MEYRILNQPAASALELSLNRGEQIISESGAMISMTPGFHLETTTHTRNGGGIFKGVKRLLVGESFFVSQFDAHQDNQMLVLAPALAGDIVRHRLDVGNLIVQESSWLASTESIDFDISFQGLGKALFSSEGVFWIRCSGQGDIFLNSFGAIYEVEVNGSHVVDTGHIVAFEDTLEFTLGKASSGWISSFTSGEGIITRFQGRGKVYCQTHNPPNFGSILGPMVRPIRR